MDNEEKRLFANVEFNLETATKMIAELVSQNANLQQKIDKAIEKVKDISFKITTGKSWYLVVLSTTTDGKELLEILGGKE